MPSDPLREVSDLAPVFQRRLSREKNMIWTHLETHDVLMLSSVIVPPGLAMWAPPLEREPEPWEPYAVGEPVHHQEVPGAASGRQGPGLRGGVQAAAQRQAANRTAHAGPAGTFHQATGRSHSVESNRIDLSVCVSWMWNWGVKLSLCESCKRNKKTNWEGQWLWWYQSGLKSVYIRNIINKRRHSFS